jgi:cysteine desulfurase
MRKRIYLDYAATAPMRSEVLKTIAPYAQGDFGNASSIHGFGRKAAEAVDKARRIVARWLNCKPLEIIFTASGTEADNLAVKGLATDYPDGHIVTTAIEHKAILETCKHLEKSGVKVTYVRPNADGIVEVKEIEKAITPKTFLVSVMYANNEIGTIQPIREIGLKLKQLNKARRRRIYFHTDAVQAGCLLSLDTQILHTDMMSLSGHKLGGPKGVGLLFVKTGVMLVPIVHGGGHERGLRSGTLNTMGIVGMARALEISQSQKLKEVKRLERLQKTLLLAIEKIPNITINGSLSDRLAYNLNFSVAGKTNDELVIGMDRRGIAVSSTSACAAGNLEPSYVIQAMGGGEGRAQSSLRITTGYQTELSDIKQLIVALKDLLAN